MKADAEPLYFFISTNDELADKGDSCPKIKQNIMDISPIASGDSINQKIMI